MLRTLSIAIPVISLLLITALVNGAGNAPATPTPAPLVVEVSAFQFKGAPTSQPIEGKPQSTIKALANQDGEYLAEVHLGDRIMHLSGKIKKAANEEIWRIEVDYSDSAPGNVQSIKSNIMTPLDQPKTIGGMNRGDSSLALALTLRENKPHKN
jgi:hypothetical protein